MQYAIQYNIITYTTNTHTQNQNNDSYEPDLPSAKRALAVMEARHVVQRVKAQGLDDTNERYGLYYRFVDPWQVRTCIETVSIFFLYVYVSPSTQTDNQPPTQTKQVESHADGGGGGPVGVLAEGTVGRMAVEPVRAGEAADIPELERLGAWD